MSTNPSGALGELRVDVMAFAAPCERCGFELWWVFGLLPSYRPRSDEFTTTDFPEAIEIARRILADPDGDTADLARQLHDRPAGRRGRSSNPNQCGACGHQADWHTFEHILIRAYHEGWIIAAEGRIPVAQWRAIRGRGQGIAWPVD